MSGPTSQPQSRPDAHVGEVFAGKFRVERELGVGGMGLVVEATHLMLDERVALKFLKKEVMLQTDVVARFLQEARAAAKLKSEHVARVLDVGVQDGVPYIVMEYLQGRNLEEILASRGPLPVKEAVELVVQAAEGISEAHARNIIHRDIKPANLFLAEREDGWPTLKILDFGISKAALTPSPFAMDLSKQIKTVQLLGSPYYMSPEQLRSTRDVDRRTDIWSLGAVLFELVTGETAWSSTELMPLAHEIATKPHKNVRALRPDVPEGFDAVIDKALAKDPKDRFQSAAELSNALLSFTESKRSRVIAAHAAQMTRSSGIDPDLPMPSMAPPALTSSGSPMPMGSSGSLPIPAPSSNPVPAATPASGAPRVLELSPTMNATPVALTTAPAAPQRPRAMSIGVEAIVVVGAAATIAFMTRSPTPTQTQATAQPPPPSAPLSVVTETPPAPTVTAAAASSEHDSKAAAEASASAKPKPAVVPPAVVKRAPTAPTAPAAPPGDLDIRMNR